MSFATIKLLGFAPDLPTDTPGAITSQQGMIPTPKGFTSGPTYLSGGGNTTLGAPSLGTFATRQNNSTRRWFVGTATKLWEVGNTGNVVTDRSGAAYNASDPSQTWSFCQFGDVTLASNKGDAIQQINAGGTFAAIANAPKASIIINAGPATSPFVLAFNINDGADKSNYLMNSGLADYTGWTIGTNQCAQQPCYEPSGKFIAAISYRDGAIAFKENSMFEVTYSSVAATPGWTFRRIASDIGCCGKNMCVNVNDTIYFADKHGFWMYDGSYPKKLPGYVHDYWAQQVRSGLITEYCQMRWDGERHNLWVSQTSQGIAGQPSQWIVWNQLSGLWANEVTIGSPTSSPTIQAREVIDFNSGSSSTTPFPLFTTLAGGPSYPAALFQYDDVTVSASNVVSPPSMTLWRIGDPVGYTEIDRIAPVWLGSNIPGSTSTCSLDSYIGQNTVSLGTTTGTIDANKLYFDLRASNNWIKATIAAYGAYEFGSVGISSQSSGQRGTR